MKRCLLPGLLAALVWVGATGIGAAQPIVVDHNAVSGFNDIPPAYIDAVKRMWVSVAGESHSSGYRLGCELLEAQDSDCQVNVTTGGAPETTATTHLRISRATWGDVGHATGWIYGYGEEDWYTSALAIDRTKNGLSYIHANAPVLSAIGFGWCWDMTGTNGPGGDPDPVHFVHWAGSSVGGPEGNLRWGLDAADYALTSNTVCLDTYLSATEQYIAHCATNGIPTVVFFTTGPVDGGSNTGERGYQRHLKNERIRQHVTAGNRVLFDYADILCWSNAGAQETRTWTDLGSTLRTFPYIHPDNMLDLDGTYSEDGDHIGQRGALRLGKAMWWMMARLAGWDGVPETAVQGWQTY